jgi:hypothetical protein
MHLNIVVTVQICLVVWNIILLVIAAVINIRISVRFITLTFLFLFIVTHFNVGVRNEIAFVGCIAALAQIWIVSQDPAKVLHSLQLHSVKDEGLGETLAIIDPLLCSHEIRQYPSD